MRLRSLSYRYAEAVLDAPEFRELKADVMAILESARVPLLPPDKVKVRKRSALAGVAGRRFFVLPVDQRTLNSQLDVVFRDRGWEVHPRIIAAGGDGPDTGLAADYRKGRLQVEVQFGNMARWYTDVFKFQLSYSRDNIDAAVLVVPTQHFANMIDENVAYFERVERELPWAKMSLTLPIWVIGIEPTDWAPVRDAYNDGAELFRRDRADAGDTYAAIPFEQRAAEVPAIDEPAP